MRPEFLRLRAFGPYAGEQGVDFAALGRAPLFLIHGNTGAGKTSLLDGLCFALYGEASGDQRSAKLLRSDHAAPDARTEVELIFALGEKRYRVLRRPEQMRPKLKGQGLTKEEAEAELWDRSLPGHPRLLASGMAKVTEACRELLGFPVDQFRQVVLLPQGQFQRLLQAPSGERETLLESLFKTLRFTRIQEALAKRASQLKAEADALFQERAALLRQAEAETPSDLAGKSRALETEREAAQALGEKCREEETMARETLARGEALAQEYQRLEAARSRLRHWESAQAAMDRARDQILAAQRAASLEHALAALGQAKDIHGQAELRFAAARADQQAAATRENSAREAHARAQAAALDLPQVELRLRLLDDALEGLPAWETAKLRRESAEADARKAQDEWARCRDLLAELTLKAQAEETSLLPLQEQAAKSAGLALAWEQAMTLARRAQARQESEQNEARLAARAQKARELWQNALQALALARQDHEERLSRRWHAQSVLLAQSLIPGEACPVCGSPHHPQPAQGETEGLDEAASRLSAQALRGKEGEAAALEEQYRECESQRAREAAQSEIHRDELADRQDITPVQAEAEAARRLAEYQAAQAAAALFAQTRETLQALRRRMEQGLAKVAETESARQAALESAMAARAQSEALEERWQFLADKWKQTWKQTSNQAPIPPIRDLDGGSEASPDFPRSQALLAWRDKQSALYRSLHDNVTYSQRESESSQRESHKAAALCQEADRQRQGTGARLRESESLFAQGLLQAGFANEEHFLASRLSEEARQQLEKARSDHDREGHAAREAEAAALRIIGQRPSPQIQELRLAHAAAQEAMAKANQGLGTLRQKAAQIEAWSRQWSNLEVSYRTAAGKYGVAAGLHQAASGTGETKVSFQRFVLGTLLDDVLELASARLDRMSRGRYTLERAFAASGGRSKAGLDLSVADSHTGTRRPAGMLSGGETFLASLALALGLADVVQAYAGGLRLDSLFIDEGFGTLDPEALDQALQALEALREGGRLVGVISHVAELKERIPARIEIKATARGSSIRVAGAD